MTHLHMDPQVVFFPEIVGNVVQAWSNAWMTNSWSWADQNQGPIQVQTALLESWRFKRNQGHKAKVSKPQQGNRGSERNQYQCPKQVVSNKDDDLKYSSGYCLRGNLHRIEPVNNICTSHTKLVTKFSGVFLGCQDMSSKGTRTSRGQRKWAVRLSD